MRTELTTATGTVTFANGVMVTLTNSAVISPSVSGAIFLQGNGSAVDVSAIYNPGNPGNPGNPAWDNKNTPGYFAAGGAFQTLVNEAVNASTSTIITMSGAARANAVISDARNGSVNGSAVSYEGLQFTGFTRTSNARITGMVGASNESSIYASVGTISNSIFRDNVVTTTGGTLRHIYGGGLVGAFSQTGGASVAAISNSVFNNNRVTSSDHIGGGGIVGAFGYSSAAAVGAISASIFSGNTITAANLIWGGGVVGLNTNTSWLTLADISTSIFSNNTVSTSDIRGGGIVGLRAATTAVMGAISKSIFSGNKVTISSIYGGGVAGTYGSTASVGAISKSVFSDNTVTASNNLYGGGVVGAYGTTTAHVGDISESFFTRNIIKATSSVLWGGLIYTADDLNILNSTFTDNTFTSGTTFGGTVSIDVSKKGTISGDENTHTVTLAATNGGTTLFQNNVANTSTNNSLAFVNLYTPNPTTPNTFATKAVLNIDAASDGTVDLYDPIKVDLNNSQTFNMNVNGAGDFLWGGTTNSITSATGAITLNAGKTTLLPGFVLTASNHAVKVNNNATLYIEGTSTLNVPSVTVANGGILEIASTGCFTTSGTDCLITSADATSGTLTVADGATVSLTPGNTPVIKANSATINASGAILNLTGYTDLPKTLIHTNNTIVGDFATIKVAGTVVNPVPDLDTFMTVVTQKASSNLKTDNDLLIDLLLVWYESDHAHGTFYIADGSFDLDTVLEDNAISGAGTYFGWDQSSLTKTGAGTLILSKENTYTCATTISAGTLQAGVADTIKDSSAVTVDGTFDLNDFDQTIN
ncbi:MAG: autotransporter-associated beta strand repeat-containing protein, partial [Candidatus Accumulibacter sp.]|nr:autotransporter-associated beta strand repeat-containing protein [Accumulibacter sp.]